MINWEDRGKLKVTFKGEDFYTITPLPFYLRRRQLLLKTMMPWLNEGMKILDFGCGDGWYVNYFSGIFKDKIQIEGCDISIEFLQKARKDYPGYKFIEVNELSGQDQYDLIYVFAVFAHMNDEEISSLLKKISSMVKKEGTLVLFEQVASKRREGKDFIKREIREYHEFIRSAGLTVKAGKLFRFPVFNFFDRKVFGKLYGFFTNEKDPYKKRVLANGNRFFRFFVRAILLFDWFPERKNPVTGTGNYFLAARKVST